LDSLTLSVVIPVLNEKSNLLDLIETVNTLGAEQVVIVDGGSVDGTYEWLEEHWQKVNNEFVLLQAPAGRSSQMNHGAAVSSGDIILFLHADTKLPTNSKQEILLARQKKLLWGRFDVSFSEDSFAMSVIAFFINTRSKWTAIATGDQAIFVDANLFNLIQGFANVPLMEDVDISKKLKQHCRPHCSTLKVQTSARRWRKNGVIKTVLQMWLYRAAFFFGFPVGRLARSYRNIR